VDDQSVPDVIIKDDSVSATRPDPKSEDFASTKKEIAAVLATGFSWNELLDAAADVYNGVR
jgi:hypothetical protein